MKFNELSQELQELWTRGVDHSVFNEDWAKMGGVVEIDYQKYSGIWNLYPALEVLAKAQFYCGHWQYVPFGEDETFGEVIIDDHNVLSKRMASHKRCAAAGIDYVPFMGWRDIDSAPKNVRMLMRNEIDVGIGTYERNLMQTQWMPLPLV